MKIIILCTQLEAGGAQRAAIRLAGEFRNDGHQCENWFLYKKRDVFKDHTNFRIIHSSPLKSKLSFLKLLKDLYSGIKESKPDIVITFAHNANVIGQVVAFLCNIKIRIASHRNPSWGYMNKFVKVIDYLWAGSGVYSAIVPVSESTKKSFSYYPKNIYNKLRVVNNGLNYVFPQISKEEARLIFGLPKHVPLVGTIGRLSPQKNQITLIKAIQSIKGAHLAIVGDGELRSELRSTVEELNLVDRVHFVGEIPQENIPAFLASLDVYAMPSLFEGLSNALVEAMYAGLPIVSSDIDAQRDVVINNEGVAVGVLLPATDVDAWGKSLQKILTDEEFSADLAKKALCRSKDFSMERMVLGFYNAISPFAPGICINKKDYEPA
jgi:glycosyltransferase involved in cell wall biosynthesis